MKILLPDYETIYGCIAMKDYNTEEEYIGYLACSACEAEGVMYTSYWFLEKIDLFLQIPLKRK